MSDMTEGKLVVISRQIQKLGLRLSVGNEMSRTSEDKLVTSTFRNGMAGGFGLEEDIHYDDGSEDGFYIMTFTNYESLIRKTYYRDGLKFFIK